MNDTPNLIPDAPPTLRIVRLAADSFKRLRAVSITPDGSVVRITGRNGAGKSSVLDAIMFALGGPRLAPEKPVRKGAKTARVEIDLGEMIVRRRATDSSQSVEIEAKDGSKITRPQEVLDKLYGALTFDPLAFTRMDDKARVEVLKRVTGLGVRFDEMDARRAKVFEERRSVNTEARSAEARLNGAAVPPPGTPDEETSITALVAELDAARDTIAENARQRKWLADAYGSLESWKKRGEQLVAELEKVTVQVKSLTASITERDGSIVALTDPDTSTIQQRMRSIETDNASVRAKKSRADLAAQAETLNTRARKLTRELEEIDVAKETALGEVKMPVKGLAFGEAGVTLDGVPFSQASSAQQLRASVAMGLAQNPRLRVMLVREGSFLDSESMASLSAIATEYDAQVWVEQVTDGQKVGIVIEDGEVAGAEAGA